jgi:hypothetical protein
LLLDAAAARVSNRDHADERTHSDRDPKYRKNTSDPIASQRNGRFPDDVLEVHQRCLSRDDPDQNTQRDTFTSRLVNTKWPGFFDDALNLRLNLIYS